MIPPLATLTIEQFNKSPFTLEDLLNEVQQQLGFLLYDEDNHPIDSHNGHMTDSLWDIYEVYLSWLSNPRWPTLSCDEHIKEVLDTWNEVIEYIQYAKVSPLK